MYWLPFAIAAGSALAGAGKKREAELARKPTEIKQPEPFKEPEKLAPEKSADLPYRPIPEAPEAPSNDGVVANGLPGTSGYRTLNQTKANRASLSPAPGTPQDQLWTGSSLTPRRATSISPPGTMNRPTPSIANPSTLQPGDPDDQLWQGSSLVPRRSVGGRPY